RPGPAEPRGPQRATSGAGLEEPAAVGARGRAPFPEGAGAAVSRPRYRDLKRNLIQFCRLLRANELLLGPGEVADVLRAIETIDIGDREDVRLSIRSIATSKPEDFPIYDALFEYFWGRQMEMEDGRGEDGGPRLGEQQAKQQTKVDLNLDPDKSPDSPPDSEDEESLPVYSPIE